MVRVVYTAEEYTDMILCLGEARGNGREAARLYALYYGDRDNHPTNNTIEAAARR